MKVMLINAVSGHGSTGRICSEIAEYLLNKGDGVQLLYAIDRDDKAYSKKISNSFLIKLNALGSKLTGLNGYFCYSSSKKIINAIEDFKPDIIHLHNIHSNYFNFRKVLSFINSRKIPLVITLHDCWFFTGKCTHYTSINCNKWKSQCHRCEKNKLEFSSLFFDQTKKMFSDKKNSLESIERLGVIGVSDWITNEAKKSFLNNTKAKFTTIYNWIDFSKFKHSDSSELANKLDIDKNKKTIFCVSESWSIESDRYKDLVKLSEKITDDFQIIVGGNHNTDSRLRNTKFIGYLSIDQLIEMYSLADVYIHLSREDSFGKVIVEALACGTPVITYNATSYPEIVEDNFGVIINVGDIDEIVRKLDFAISKKFGNSDWIELLKEKYSKTQLISTTYDFYENVINGGD